MDFNALFGGLLSSTLATFNRDQKDADAKGLMAQDRRHTVLATRYDCEQNVVRRASNSQNRPIVPKLESLEKKSAGSSLPIPDGLGQPIPISTCHCTLGRSCLHVSKADRNAPLAKALTLIQFAKTRDVSKSGMVFAYVYLSDKTVTHGFGLAQFL